eukprot:1333382-Amorphochlora_amoeboformis.AAC.1
MAWVGGCLVSDSTSLPIIAYGYSLGQGLGSTVKGCRPRGKGMFHLTFEGFALAFMSISEI